MDLKPENILIGEKCILKLVDFGFSCFLKDCDGQRLGSEGYMAPEVLNKSYKNGVKVDIFAAGVILFILCTGLFPFS